MSSDPSLAPYALAVDDDALTLMQVSDILIEAGFRTLEAQSGEEALDLLDQHGDDIVLLFTDVHMPGMTGFELARETAASRPHVAIVVASGRAVPTPGELPEHARFIGKPFSAETVHGHLQEILPDGMKPEPLKRKG